ncbi:hypothetical protein AMTR_s00062p00186870 [Amborella trichopoda]|uniref:Uncharacterized protein n=1 Tax=Amborella trichopoda TaxID=13333 RepID=U5DE38_AMBTC|nr:hypothetical protein AMTR_s00062p00186870 [Amborella trichopoda]
MANKSDVPKDIFINDTVTPIEDIEDIITIPLWRYGTRNEVHRYARTHLLGLSPGQGAQGISKYPNASGEECEALKKEEAEVVRLFGDIPKRGKRLLGRSIFVLVGSEDDT